MGLELSGSLKASRHWEFGILLNLLESSSAMASCVLSLQDAILILISMACISLFTFPCTDHRHCGSQAHLAGNCELPSACIGKLKMFKLLYVHITWHRI